ncbi:hypothetical protein COY05_04440 [Candidatus Peregrinibacteria bacterium CG_4_10_14_0_2_um_filter_38_24]|nr:MAG: hypothetical protein COY05_04440 [Candidatus Peregrinibacteria bacterium CG_4_10_14_0_2_um_filter_38_24]PJC39253.1 MAG: hypothetical protein CO044_00840 [Candidatus Peregrinibacteria bacterium CG_4_9_14_0_2_um_filter_38_9]
MIKEIKSVKELLNEGNVLLNLTIQDLDFKKEKLDWANIKLANTTFLGCDMDDETESILRQKGAIIYPKVVGLPYNPYRKSLYTWEELIQGNDMESGEILDTKIYNHFVSFKNSGDINEALCERIHDHAIDDAIYDIIGIGEDGMTKKKCVGIMGGHSVLRDDPAYEKVAMVSKKLAGKGYLILSGGGPGIMEAANLGAYLAGKTDAQLTEAIEILKVAPRYQDENYIVQSKKVIDMYPTGVENIAIPTWFYGHEPLNIFATSIAKYFSNAIREDVLLAVALHGIIYGPGSAGTVQEIFTDAAQDHYSSFGWVSPMIFFGKKFWSEDCKVYELVSDLSKGLKYHDMLAISDDTDEVVKFIEDHPPVKG